MIDWIDLKDETPKPNTHYLTVNARMQCPTIFHNIADMNSRFILEAREQSYHNASHIPTHFALMNFPKV